MTKHHSRETIIAVAAGTALILSFVPWMILRPANTAVLLDDALGAFDASKKYGEACRVYVNASGVNAENLSEKARNSLSLLSNFSVESSSHILASEHLAYRLLRSRSPLGATDDSGIIPSLVLETISDEINEYARYDTSGPWIFFPKKTLSDMGEYIQKMFRDQEYYSLHDIRRESMRFYEMRIDKTANVAVFRGKQTEVSLDNARELFQYQQGTYAIKDQYADIYVDANKKYITKTILFALFDYQSQQDESLHFQIPLYQECAPVKEKDLEVHLPSNTLPAVRGQVEQYLLFKVLPK